MSLNSLCHGSIQHIKTTQRLPPRFNLHAAQQQGFSIYYLKKTNLSVANGVPLDTRSN